MKSYFLILIENFIGIGYLILFLFGFFNDNLNLTIIGGIGMLIFMFIMIREQPKNLTSFLFMCVIGSLVAYFVSKWWLGLFWVSAFFSAGQFFSIIALLKNKKQIIYQAENKMNEKISFIEILSFTGLLIGPVLLANS